MVILLTGQPGTNKGALLSNLLTDPLFKGVSGFLTENISLRKESLGFRMSVIGTNESEIIAHKFGFETNNKFGDYYVYADRISSVIKKTRVAETTFIDEVGFMQTCCNDFNELVKNVTKKQFSIISVTKDPKNNLANELRQNQEFVPLELTSKNYNRLLEIVKNLKILNKKYLRLKYQKRVALGQELARLAVNSDYTVREVISATRLHLYR